MNEVSSSAEGRGWLHWPRAWIARCGAFAARRPRTFRFLRWTAGLCVLAAVLAATFIGGIVAEQQNLPARARRFLDREMVAVNAKVGDDAQALTWQTIITNLHTLEYIELRVGAPMDAGGGITEVRGHILMVSPLGRINYLNPALRLGTVGIAAPMGLELLRKSKYPTDTLFSWHHFRAYDVLALPRGGDDYDLYVSMSRFVNEQCFQFAVYKTPIKVTADSITPAADTHDWQEVFTARPGCLRPKDRGWRFLGFGGGGRMALLDANTLLVSVGDHQYDGFNDSWAAAQDLSTDLGKIVAIDLRTGKNRMFAVGVRNPQGLVVMRDGRIFDTEHGPQAGDEINLIRDGGNYGWPLATYGVNYGYPRRDWPFAKTQADHGGDFDKPVFVFTPSIGISNIIEAEPKQFPLWGSDAILASLRGSTLFHLRLEGDRVRYVEPIYSRQGVRFRDITTTAEGGFAAFTNAGTLMIFRNAELHTQDPRTVSVVGYGAQSPPFPEEVPPENLTPAQRGKELFAVSCSNCHSPTTELGPGPPLGGIVGRPVGAAQGFGYSPALADYQGVWTEELLLEFLTDPSRHFHGTVMPPPTMDWLEYPKVVAYLATLTEAAPIKKK
jgi:cytochrome c2